MKLFFTFIIAGLIPALFFSSKLYAEKDYITFYKAKILLSEIYENYNIKRKTTYCECDFTNAGKIIKESCGYSIRKYVNRGNRVEWEHVVPLNEAKKKYKCKNRKDCMSNSEKYKRFAGDLHNIIPVIGELNRDRWAFFYNIIKDEKRKYGLCDFEVDFKNKIVEVRTEIRGLISRKWLFMINKYHLNIDHEYIELYKKWNLLYPPTKNEIIFNNIIEKIQGDSNIFIKG